MWIHLLLVIVVFWALIRYGGQSGRWMVAACIGLLMVGTVALVAAIMLPSVSRARAKAVAVVQTSSSGQIKAESEVAVDELSDFNQQTPAPSRILDRDKTDELNPDVFPSVASAATHVAKMLLDDRDRVVAQVPLLTVHVLTNIEPSLLPGNVPREIHSAVIRALPAVKVLVADLSTTRPAAADRTDLLLKLWATPSPRPRDERHGQKMTLHGTLIGSEGQIERKTTIIGKTWVDDLARYLFQSSSGHIYRVIDPPQLAATANEARNNAIRLATTEVEQSILIRHPELRRSSATTEQERRRVIESELRRGQTVADRFVQRFDRQYGNVWREALLLDLSDERIGPVADSYRRLVINDRDQLKRTLLSGGGLLLLVLVVYAFLNAATKGYYVWSLRIAGTVILVAGVFTVLALA